MAGNLNGTLVARPATVQRSSIILSRRARRIYRVMSRGAVRPSLARSLRLRPTPSNNLETSAGGRTRARLPNERTYVLAERNYVDTCTARTRVRADAAYVCDLSVCVCSRVRERMNRKLDFCRNSRRRRNRPRRKTNEAAPRDSPLSRGPLRRVKQS